MNHHFLELQAKEKIEKYRSEGMSSQIVTHALSGNKQIFNSLRQYLTRLLKRRHEVEPVIDEVADNPEYSGAGWVQRSMLSEESH